MKSEESFTSRRLISNWRKIALALNDRRSKTRYGLFSRVMPISEERRIHEANL
jgi:hypothetical protein